MKKNYKKHTPDLHWRYEEALYEGRIRIEIVDKDKNLLKYSDFYFDPYYLKPDPYQIDVGTATSKFREFLHKEFITEDYEQYAEEQADHRREEARMKPGYMG